MKEASFWKLASFIEMVKGAEIEPGAALVNPNPEKPNHRIIRQFAI